MQLLSLKGKLLKKERHANNTLILLHEENLLDLYQDGIDNDSLFGKISAFLCFFICFRVNECRFVFKWSFVL